MNKKEKVIIIGAGPAGLTAAYELLKKSNKYEVIVLEEMNQVGGISKTVNYNGNRMDLGGHRFFTKNARVQQFWESILPVNKKFLIRKRVSRIYYLNHFFDYPISLKKETIKNLGFIRTIKVGFSYIKSTIFKKKEDNLENFYINRFGKKLYNMFFENYTEKLWGRHPKNISADWGAQRVKGLSIKAVIKDMFIKTFNIKKDLKKQETSLIDQFLYPKYGPGQLWETVEEDIEKMGGTILKNHKVTKINIKNNKIISLVCKTEKKEKLIDGNIFISSMPIKDFITNIDGTVPTNILNIAKNLPYRDFMTVGLLLKKIKLKNKEKENLIPDCWIYIQDSNVKLGRLQIFNNWSPYMLKNPEKEIFIGLEYFCNENDKYWNMSDEEFIKFAINELEKINIIDANDVIESHRIKVKKAYPAYFDTYNKINEVIMYLNKFENLYCIGRNGQHRYNNMDHSMMTAFETVDNILNSKKEKDNIWNVNIEKEYHEEKSTK